MQKTITSVRLWIVDRLFNCLDFFDVIPVENKYRLRFGTWKIQIFVETHKKSSSYKLSTLSLFFSWMCYEIILVDWSRVAQRTSVSVKQEKPNFKLHVFIEAKVRWQFDRCFHFRRLCIFQSWFFLAFTLKPTAKKYFGTPTVIR